MTDSGQSRRDFIKTATAVGTGVSLALGSAASYARILGANDRINLAFAGVRSRGKELIAAANAAEGAGIRIHSLCDVDSQVLAEVSATTADLISYKQETEKDFRRVLEDKDIDAVVIATPDHTHAPFATYAMQADKHVYVEKPCSHNPHEGEMLVAAMKRYGKVVQMGNQQRSAPTSIEAVRDIAAGAIGRPYLGKAWYTNRRGSIGSGAVAPVPKWLDWDLWQGPAPRRDYKDNYVHYNWHWFRHWGTGEINNNGLHEIDICRWALGVELPTRVNSTGGRYHFDDDWEFYDTQVASFEFDDHKMIVWEGRSCNGLEVYGRGRGATIHGTEGTVLLDRNGYFLYDNASNLIKQVNERSTSATTDLVGGGALVSYHLRNFFAAIREGQALRSPIDEGHKSTLLCHLGNMAQKSGHALEVDPANGRVTNDDTTMSLWQREYAPGWEPKV